MKFINLFVVIMLLAGLTACSNDEPVLDDVQEQKAYGIDGMDVITIEKIRQLHNLRVSFLMSFMKGKM